ncbi:MAG: ABC transporter ATP-binding protein/permease [Gemmataceae bacterium]|nr:ABC transporter ATP-binding protein/permease [Gemmataceae bacterium]
MEKAAFGRAAAYLNFTPLAKWGAFACGIGAAVLFVVLLMLLALFADMAVHRGEIPSFSNLPARERSRFVAGLALPENAEALEERNAYIRKALAELQIDDPAVVQLAQTPNGQLTEPDREFQRHLLWFAELPAFLRDAVSDRAGDMVRDQLRAHIQKYGLQAAVHHNLPDWGILGLVVRGRSGLQGTLAAPAASWADWTWANGNEAYLQGLFLVAVLVALVRVVLHYFANMLAAKATIEAVTWLRKEVYEQTYRLGTLAFRALGPSEAVSISTRHLEAVHAGLFAWLTGYFREPIKFGLLLAFAMLVNFWLALAFLLFAVLVWLVGGQIAAYFRREGRAAEHHSANQLALIQESLTLMRLVKVYLMETFNLARVDKQLGRYADAQMQRYRGEAIYRPVFAFLGLLAALVLLLVAGHIVLGGHLGVASALVMVTALVCLYWPMVRFLENRRLIRRSRHSAKALFDFLDRTGSVGQDTQARFLSPLSDRLEFDNVTLREPGSGRKLLHGVSLTIGAGQQVALVGSDDMEKHALVYLLPRFLDPSGGQIRIDGLSLRGVTLDSLRAQIGMVMQHNLVFNDTVANNIGCGDPAYNVRKIIDAAKFAHAHQFIQKLPQGYETPIGDLGHALSTSEKYRIGLARAILRDPAIFIIEEPLTPMDDDSKAMVDDTLNRVVPGRTVIYLAHRLSTIRSCDRVVLLHQGQIEADGEHRGLLASSDLYRHLQYLEFNEFASAAAPVAGPVGAASGQ